MIYEILALVFAVTTLVFLGLFVVTQGQYDALKYVVLCPLKMQFREAKIPGFDKKQLQVKFNVDYFSISDAYDILSSPMWTAKRELKGEPEQLDEYHPGAWKDDGDRKD